MKSENGRADEMTRNEILIIKANACQKIITLKIYVMNIFHIFPSLRPSLLPSTLLATQSSFFLNAQATYR